MAKYQERVTKELFKLEKKANKLQEFINSDDYPFIDNSEDDELMVSQLHAMWVYASILKRRIQKFEKAIGPDTSEPANEDLFNNIGVVEVKDGNVKEALDEVFNIIKNKMKDEK